MGVRDQLGGVLRIKWREAWTRADVMDMGKRRHIRRLRNKMDRTQQEFGLEVRETESYTWLRPSLCVLS